jgi:hypothetical protein
MQSLEETDWSIHFAEIAVLINLREQKLQLLPFWERR